MPLAGGKGRRIRRRQHSGGPVLQGRATHYLEKDMSSKNTTRTVDVVTATTFAEAEDLERVTLAVFEATVARREEAHDVLAALQCREEIRVIDGVLPDDPEDWVDSDYCEYIAPCLLPTAHTVDHSPGACNVEAPLDYRAAVAAFEMAAASASDAREAWANALEALRALFCEHVSETNDGLPCVLRRGHAADVPHVHPTTIRLVY